MIITSNKQNSIANMTIDWLFLRTNEKKSKVSCSSLGGEGAYGMPPPGELREICLKLTSLFNIGSLIVIVTSCSSALALLESPLV